MRRFKFVIVLAVVCAVFSAPAGWCQPAPRAEIQDTVSWNLSPLAALWTWLSQWLPETKGSESGDTPVRETEGESTGVDCGVSIDPTGVCHP
jgi:hypothetical protein